MLRYTATKYPKKNPIWLFILFFFALILALSTHPFLKLPFDPWEHLIKIRSIFDDGKCFLYWPENTSSFCYWHLTWAKIFSIININDTFVWAKTIHSVQFLFCLLCLFYFSSSVIKLCDRQRSPGSISLISFFATLFWFAGNGTNSVEYQQAWIMWYSLTYQGVTIPLFWLITSFTLQLSFNADLSHLKKLSFMVLITTGFLIIAFYHPSEAIYYLIFLFLSLLFTPFMSLKQKAVFGSLFFTIIPGVLFVIATYMNLPFLHGASIQNGIANFIQQVDIVGNNITEKGGNRLLDSFSELAMLSSVAALLFWTASLFFFRKKHNRITIMLTVAVILFFSIPTSKWIAGITGVLLYENIVWRFFFASPWFLFLPLIVFIITSRCRFPKTYASLLLIIILSGTVLMSEIYLNKALSGNVRSLYYSFFKERVGLQYSDSTLALLKATIAGQTEKAEKKDVLLYLRSDLATVARAVFGYYAYSHRRTFIPMHKFYAQQIKNQYELVPIHLPGNFPKDRNIFLHFKLDNKNISRISHLTLDGESSVLFHLDHIDLDKKYLFIEGWAFLEGQLLESEVFIILQSSRETFIFNTSQLFRRDVGEHFGSLQLENKGFLATIKTKDLNPGNYRIGILVKQKQQQGVVFSKRSVTIPAINITSGSN